MKRFALVAAGLAFCASMSGSEAQTAPPSSVSGAEAGGQSLSSKLNKTDGVITPKSDVDPGIKVPAPDPHPNSTPVIPPAATGGGTAK